MFDLTNQSEERFEADKAIWTAEKKDLLKELAQAESLVQKLQGEAKTHDSELSRLRDEVCQAKEV